MNANLVITMVFASFTLATPLVFAALGGYFSERSGVINIALEGNMIIATVLGMWATSASGNPLVGIVSAIAGSCLLSLAHYTLTQTYKVEQVVSGMSCNLLAMGFANVIDRVCGLSNGAKFPHVPVPLFIAVALVLPFGIHWLSNNTKFGIRLLASGSDPDKARLMGVQPTRVRLGALLLTGALCGLSGIFMLSNVGVYTEGMTANRGYIALAALIIAGWKPIRALVACLAFGLFEAIQVQMQGVPIFGIEVPRELWLCLPYLATVVALGGFLLKNRAPSGLGKV